MAVTNTAGHNIIPKFCHLCESERNIQWKCQTCDQLICGKCRAIHLKIKTAPEHEMTRLDTAKHAVTEDFIPCKEHKKKAADKYCSQCDVLVCSECISTLHLHHKFESIETAFHEKRDKLVQLEAAIFQDLMFCKVESKDLIRNQRVWDSSYESTIEQLDKRELDIIDEIKQYGKFLRDEIKMEQKTRKKMVYEKEKQIEDAVKILEEEKDEIKGVIELNRKGIIFSTANELGNNLPELSFKRLPREVTNFSPSKLTREHISRIFGSLHQVYLSKHDSNIDLKIRKKYSTDMKNVDAILTLDDKSAWISNQSAQVLRKIDVTDNNKTRTISEVSLKIYDLAMTQQKEILLSLIDSSEVKLLTEEGEIKPFVSLSSMFPLGIHVTSDNNILVGLRDSAKETKESLSKILRYGTDRLLKQTYECDKQKGRLFSWPHRITTNVNKDIVVLDTISKDIVQNGGTNDEDKINGRLVVLSNDGTLKWTYFGHPHVNCSSDTSFDPSDIVTTSIGHIVVADLLTSSLHVLSREGDLLTCSQMGAKGVTHPLSLSIDTRGQIWIGCDKIYIVKFTCQ